MSALTKKLKEKKDPSAGNVYKKVYSSMIVGLFLTIGIIILSIFKVFTLTSTLVGFIAIVAIICLAMLMALPWIRWIERQNFKKTAIIFLSLIAICAVVWIICVFLIINLYKKSNVESFRVEDLVGTLNFIKFSLILTIQFFTASFIGGTIVKYRKTMIPFQIIAYISNLFVDFWFTTLLLSVTLTKGDGLQVASWLPDVLFNRPMWIILAMTIVYSALSNAIIKRFEQRKVGNFVEDSFLESVENEEVEKETTTGETAEDRLLKLKKLYDSELISKENYEKKKQDIIDNM